MKSLKKKAASVLARTAKKVVSANVNMSCIMICTSVLAAFPLQAYATSGTISETELDSSAGIYLEDKASVMLAKSTNKWNLKSGFKTIY